MSLGQYAGEVEPPDDRFDRVSSKALKTPPSARRVPLFGIVPVELKVTMPSKTEASPTNCAVLGPLLLYSGAIDADNGTVSRTRHLVSVTDRGVMDAGVYHASLIAIGMNQRKHGIHEERSWQVLDVSAIVIGVNRDFSAARLIHASAAARNEKALFSCWSEK